MNVEPRNQALLLLTVWLKDPAQDAFKPLTPTEWARFAQWLERREMVPEELLCGDPAGLLTEWTDSGVTVERILYLMGRAAALGLALERWQRAGLWILGRWDSDYPARLAQRLALTAPPMLFGCGNRLLLNQGGLAVIGSRDATEEDLAFTAELARATAAQGHSIVSGGARGVDEAAMLSALGMEGTVVGVLADGLLRAATSAKFRQGLMRKDLVLVSAFNPEAGFDVGNAMARNKYVYCLSDAAVVVATGKNKGGTWNGAVENIRKAWVPLWVKPHPDGTSGNAALVKSGGRWLPEGPVTIQALIEPVEKPEPEPSLFSVLGSDTPPARIQGESDALASAGSDPRASGKEAGTTRGGGRGDSVPAVTSKGPYDHFLEQMERETRLAPESAEVLQERLNVGRTQLRAWLKRAIEEGKVTKSINPARYQSAGTDQGSLGF